MIVREPLEVSHVVGVQILDGRARMILSNGHQVSLGDFVLETDEGGRILTATFPIARGRFFTVS